MAAYPIITQDSPAVEVTTDSSSLTYQMLINTLTFTSYKIKQVYMEADSFSQGTTQFQYISVKSNGQRDARNYSNYGDLYQYLPVFFKDLQDENLVLDNMSVVALNVQPGELVKMNFWTDSVSFNDLLDEPVNSDTDKKIVLMPVQKNRPVNKNVKTILALSVLGVVLYFLIKDD